MFERSRIMSSSLPPRQKAYDYLAQIRQSYPKKSYRQQDQFLIQSQNNKNIQQSIKTPQGQQYELIVEFELRREKQKTLILQQRLRNKESFIKQMKQFQDELTLAYQKCQQQLQYYKKQCQNYEGKFNSFGTFSNIKGEQPISVQPPLIQPQVISTIIQNQADKQLIRQYLQQIAQLKHLVIRLQEEINYYQKRQKNRNNIAMSSSAKRQYYPSNKSKQEIDDICLKSVQSKNKNEATPKSKEKKQQKKGTKRQSKQRSKTLTNQFVNQKQQEDFTALSKISECIHQQTHKITSFINHFLTMCQFFYPELGNQNSIKHKLKKAWKWIKNTIVQWNYLKKQKLDKVRQYKIGNIVLKYLPLNNLTMEQIQGILEKLLMMKSFRQKGKNR